MTNTAIKPTRELRTPEMLPNGLIVMLSAAAAVIAVAGIRELSWLLGPGFLALMLVIAVSPIQRRLMAWGLPSWAATVIMLLVIYATLLALVAVLAFAVVQLIDILPQYSNQAASLWNSATKPLTERQLIDSNTLSTLGSQVQLGRVLDVLNTVVGQLTSITSMLFLILLLTFFMGLDAAGFSQRIRSLWFARPSAGQALVAFAHGTRRYLLVSSIFGVICAVLDTALLYWLAVPLPWLWGILSFITNYIPNIGFFMGLIPPAMLAILVGGPKTALFVVLGYMLINLVIQTGIQPKYVGDVVGLNVTTTFVAMAFWTWALGALGALLAIPLTLLAKALLVDADPNTRWINVIISSADPNNTDDGVLTADEVTIPYSEPEPEPEPDAACGAEEHATDEVGSDGDSFVAGPTVGSKANATE